MYRTGRLAQIRSSAPAEDPAWLKDLFSHNPRVADAAARQLREQGTRALPVIQETLRNPTAAEEQKKAALKGCAVLGTAATPALNEVAAHLTNPTYTLQASAALGFMGADAFLPLRDALASEDPLVRKESLRAIGKLHDRASLDSTVVIPLLLDGLVDIDPGVRMVSAVYLGIIHEGGPVVVPELAAMLEDEDAEVRTAAATALGSFGPDAEMAVPALTKAKGDPDENVAREAGVALVRLNK